MCALEFCDSVRYLSVHAGSVRKDNLLTSGSAYLEFSTGISTIRPVGLIVAFLSFPQSDTKAWP